MGGSVNKNNDGVEQADTRWWSFRRAKHLAAGSRAVRSTITDRTQVIGAGYRCGCKTHGSGPSHRSAGHQAIHGYEIADRLAREARVSTAPDMPPPPPRLQLLVKAVSANNPPDAPRTFVALLASDLLSTLMQRHVWPTIVFRNDRCHREIWRRARRCQTQDYRDVAPYATPHALSRSRVETSQDSIIEQSAGVDNVSPTDLARTSYDKFEGADGTEKRETRDSNEIRLAYRTLCQPAALVAEPYVISPAGGTGYAASTTDEEIKAFT